MKNHKYWDQTRTASVIGGIIWTVIMAIWVFNYTEPKTNLLPFLFFMLAGFPNVILQSCVWFEYQSSEQKRLYGIFKDENISLESGKGKQ